MKVQKKIENVKEDAQQVYEIGYTLISSIPEEKVASEVASLKEILIKKDAEFINEEAPELIDLAYTMIKKIGTANKRFDQGYFGWMKFSLSKKDIESIKKSFDENPNMLRMLLISTIKENTYLGKKSSSAIVKSDDIAPVEVQSDIISEVSIDPIIPEGVQKSDTVVKEA